MNLGIDRIEQRRVLENGHDVARLRERLIEMRAETLDRMARRGEPEPGHLPLIAGINAMLEALAAEDAKGARCAARAVVSDDGHEIRLTLYAERVAIATGGLDPARCISLAGRLLDAAGRRVNVHALGRR